MRKLWNQIVQFVNNVPYFRMAPATEVDLHPAVPILTCMIIMLPA